MTDLPSTLQHSIEPPATLAPTPIGSSGPFAPPVHPEPPAPKLLIRPVDGLPPVIQNPAELAAATERLRAGQGPVAVDAERAHGFRYSQRAYLVQLRRTGASTHLIDPIAFGAPADLSALGDALADTEWVIHAASQDLPCLAEIGLRPGRLFDTELAGRLLNYPRVALGTLLEEIFGVRLLKEHSAADWSTRPIPAEWLTYAALDVELLLDLRDALAQQLMQAGKWDWAQQEFAALVAGVGLGTERRGDPWRRTSGIHRVRSRRGLAYVAALWRARDEIARRLDRAPGRILPDAAITDLAANKHPDRATLRQHPAFARRQAKRFEANWLDALGAVASQRDAELPPLHVPTEGPPQARVWAAKNPAAAARLAAVRDAVLRRAAELEVPVENLLTPEHLRRLAWQPPKPVTYATVDAALTAYGARPWQREQVVGLLTPLLQGPPAPSAT